MSKTRVVTVRLEQRERYLAELAARRQYRSLSSFVRAAIKSAVVGAGFNDRLAERLWDDDPGERLTALARHDETLLTDAELRK